MELVDGERLPALSSRVVNTDEPIIAVMRSVVASASSRSPGRFGPGGIASLAQGAVHWHPPAVALRAAADAALGCNAAPSSSYGDDMGLPELREAVLRKCERDHGLLASEHEAMVSAGANLAVSALTLALLDGSAPSNRGSERDAAVLFPPYYFNAKMAVQLANAEVVLGESDPETMLPDVGWLERRLREEEDDGSDDDGDGGDGRNGRKARIRMVYLVNPGNPSGVVVPYETIQRLVDVCSGKDRRKRGKPVFLVLDGTYEAFAPSRPAPRAPLPSPSPVQFPLPSAPHVIHVGSFSKAYGAAGWRVGYVVYPRLRRGRRRSPSDRGGGGAGVEPEGTSSSGGAASEDVIGEQLLKIQDTLPIHASIASQRLALACLEGGGWRGGAKSSEASTASEATHGREWVLARVAGLAESRRAAERALSHLGPGSRVWGEGAIYLFCRLPPRETDEATAPATKGREPADDREFVRFCVEEHGVAVIPGSSCGAPGCVRVAYGKPAPGPEFEEAAARLAGACKAWVARSR